MAFVNRGPFFFFNIRNKLISNNIEGTQNNMELFRRRRAISFQRATETTIQRCYYKKVFLKYAANLQENTHAKVKFQ